MRCYHSSKWDVKKLATAFSITVTVLIFVFFQDNFSFEFFLIATWFPFGTGVTDL